MHLDPLEICNLALLNRAFHAASSADFIWETKLPSNYRFILDRVFDDHKTMADLGKKDIFAKLCRPIPFDGAQKFQKVAYLQHIWWLEVDGELEFQFPAGTYSLFFRLQLGKSTRRMGRRVCNTEHVHGWNIKPVSFELTTSNGEHAVSQCFLDNPGNWVYYHVGDFVVLHPNEMTKIKFSLTQIDCTHTKGGLSLDAVFIYPSNLDSEMSTTFKL
ncbi:hypothetical protein GH714_038897 [Hevea brasiliensis]|uniref:F-box domain-containing protein n=1 Tax=Hevea brasiliensis TaxID=3981 RepID=A0A6A6MSD2_HEVBR|nr:hypothetical protein GH714_038897 [Hevea brasiliensis]